MRSAVTAILAAGTLGLGTLGITGGCGSDLSDITGEARLAATSPDASTTNRPEEDPFAGAPHIPKTTRTVQFHYRQTPVVDFGDWLVWGRQDLPMPGGLTRERTVSYSTCVRVYPPYDGCVESFHKHLFERMVADLLGEGATIEEGIDTLTHGTFPDAHQGIACVVALERADVRAWFAEEAARILEQTDSAGLFYDNMPVATHFGIEEVPLFEQQIVAVAREIRQRVGTATPIAFNGLVVGFRSLGIELSKVLDYGQNEGQWFDLRTRRDDVASLVAHATFFEEVQSHGCGVWLTLITESETVARNAWILAKIVCPEAYVYVGPSYMEAPIQWSFYDIDVGEPGPLTQNGEIFTRSFERAVFTYDRAHDRFTMIQEVVPPTW